MGRGRKSDLPCVVVLYTNKSITKKGLLFYPLPPDFENALGGIFSTMQNATDCAKIKECSNY